MDEKSKKKFDTLMNEIAISATVLASHTLSEVLALAEDNCREEGVKLSYLQKMHINQSALFAFREFEQKMRSHIEVARALYELTENDEFIDDLIDRVQEARNNGNLEAFNEIVEEGTDYLKRKAGE